MTETKLAGINIEQLNKGDYFTPDQVLHAYGQLEPELADKLERYRLGDRKSDPASFAAANVIKHIEKLRTEIGRPVVCRSDKGGIRVLTDAEAVPYLDAQANAGLRKHKNKTNMLLTAIDTGNLNDHQRRQLETHQRKHAFILASHQGARTQSMRMQRKGHQLPDYTSAIRQAY